jgi:hypothetical protein
MRLRFAVVGTVLVISGCVSAPRETIELAEIVDRQITEMQVSHERFVHLYYNKLRDDIDSFLEEKWIPQFVANVVKGSGENGKQFVADLDIAYRLATVDWEKAIRIEGIEDENVKNAIHGAIEQLTTQEKARLGMVLLDFSRGVQEQINERRKSLISPIDQQEAYILDQFRATYTDLQQGTSAIKAHLAAVVNFVNEPDKVLEKLGVLDTQKRIMSTAIRLNKEAMDVLNGAKQAELGITTFFESMDKKLQELENIGHSKG